MRDDHGSVMFRIFRRRVKAFFECAMSVGAERAIRHLGTRGATLVLAYHNVIAENSRRGGDASLHLGFDRFRRQLDLLQRCTRVVSLDALLADESGVMPDDDRPVVAISFDDAYADALSVALPELAARGLPATVFVAPALLGAASTWWDLYLGQVQRESNPLRTYALEALRGDAATITAYAVSGGWTTSRGAPIASEALLEKAASTPGITLGAHSMTHPNLARLDPRQLEWELVTSLTWLRARFAVVRPWLAYPYGLTNVQVEHAAERAGYSAGFLVDGAWATGRETPLRRPRLNVPAGVSDRGFLLRLAGR